MIDHRPLPLPALLLSLLLAAGCSDTNDARWDLGTGDLRAADSYPFQLDTSSQPVEGGVSPEGGPPVDLGQDAASDGPLPADGPPGLLTAPFTLDFEANNGGLTSNSKDWEWGKLNFKAGTNCDSTSSMLAPSSAHSGSAMWGTKLNDCYTGNKSSAGACKADSQYTPSILTLKFKIPVVLTKAYLRFYQWSDVFYDFDWHAITVNGKVAAKSSTYGGGCPSSTPSPVKWEKQSIDISSYFGQTVTVQFIFYATGAVQYSGWYLDDISVASTPL